MISSIRGLHKHFGDLEVLHGIDFDMYRGQKIVILGPSGSGKSTILRCINQLEQYDAGTIEFMGDSVDNPKKLNHLRMHVGMVFQKFNVFNHMTVLQNVIEAPIHVKHEEQAEVLRNAHELLMTVGLADRENAKARLLSGGQQQRVAIARALAMHPDIMLFDEPTSALDPELVGDVLKVMRKVAKSGMSMIVVTHEMNFARDVADRILFMADGKILADAPPAEFFASAKTAGNERVRQFLSKVGQK